MGSTIDVDVNPDSVVAVSRHRVGWTDDTCKATVRNSVTRRREGSVGGVVVVVAAVVAAVVAVVQDAFTLSNAFPLSKACKQ